MEGQDKDFFSLIARGDQEMFEILFDNYALRVKQYAFDQLHDDHDAEEIVQATFTAVFLRNRGRAIRHNAFRTISHLLVATAKGLIADLRRRRQREKKHEEALRRICGLLSEQPDQRALKNEMRRMVMKAIALLPIRWRLPAELYFLRQYTHEEVAEELKIPVNTVSGYIARARGLLATTLRKYFKGDAE